MSGIFNYIPFTSPAIPPRDAANRLTVDRTVLTARTAVAALVTLGVSITASRQLGAGRYAPLLSAAASIGLAYAAYVRESSQAKNAILQRAVDLFYEKQVPVDVMDYIVQNPDAYHAICIDPRTDLLKHNEERLTQLIQRVKQSSVKPDPQIEALSEKLEKKDAEQVIEELRILNSDETKSASWDAILKFNDYSEEEDSLFVRMVDKIFDESSPSLKYGSYLKALRSGNQDIINYIEQNKKVAPADFLRGTSGVPKDVKDTIDLETFQLLCKDAELDKTDFYPVWNLILKFNDLSGHALALFDKLLERRPISKKDQIYFCLQYAIDKKRPGVVESLFKNYSDNAVIKADHFLYTPNKPDTVIKDIDRMTFQAICWRCQDIDLRTDKKLDITIHYDLWQLVCKFDYHSTEENSLFIKLMKLIDESPHSSIVQEFLYAVKQNCPSVIEFLLESKRIENTDYYMPSDRFSCWSGLQNARTAELLQEYEFDVNEHPELLDCVIFEKTFYPRPSGFTQIDHVRAILKAGVKREFVEAVVKKLPVEKNELLSTLNKYLDQN